MLIALVLGKLGEYLRHGPFDDAVSLWGMVLSILIGAVVLCGIAYDFASSPDAPPMQRRRILGIPLMVVAAGSLLTSLSYFLVSLATWALLPALWPDPFQLASVVFGDLYIVNLVIATVAIGLLAALYRLSQKRRTRSSRSRTSRRLFGFLAATIYIVVAVASVSVAATPIRNTLAFVTGPRSTAATSVLRHRLPTTMLDGCGSDYLLIAGQLASLACHAADATEVSYHSFETPRTMDASYRAALHARGVSPGTGSCAAHWPAEGPYRNGRGTGHVACYVDRRGAWLLWTDGQTLCIATRQDGHSDELYASWSAGEYWLRPT
jgi:hypothetical protein